MQGKTSIYNKTKSHPDPCNFGWVIDNNATLRPEKMLLSVPEHYVVRSRCNSKCTKQCNCKNNDVDCTKFCKFDWVIDAATMSEHYTVRCGCKSKWTKRFKCKNSKLDYTEFFRCKGLCETSKNILENTF